MKAAQLNSYGGQDALKTVDTAKKPAINDDQLLVQVHAAGVNPFDFKIREGMVRQMAELSFPATLGGDVAGVVAEIGSKVTDFKVGQAVYGLAGALSSNGSFAEFSPVSATSLAPKPNSVDFITAAALPLASVSAYQALFEHIKLQAGQKILIHGGGGGIGSIAIQLAKNVGAYVATTVSAADIDYAKSLGADQVIDYKTQDFSHILKDFDAVFDNVGGETNTKSYTVLKTGGTFVSMVGQENEKLAQQYGIHYISQATHVTTERLTKIAGLVDQHIVRINIAKIFPLVQAAEALEFLKTNHPRGKVVIQVTD